MHSTVDDVRQQLIDDLTARAGHHDPDADPAALRRVPGLYYRHTPTEDLTARTREDLLGAVMSHHRAARFRSQGGSTVAVFTPTLATHGWTSAGRTVVEIVTEDMPYLVDSVTMALLERGRTIRLVIHPQILVRRNLAGDLLEICEPDPVGQDHQDDSVLESWMHVEIDRETEDAELLAIADIVRDVLRDVREVSEDSEKMTDCARSLAARLGDVPSRPGQIDIRESRAFLAWLADDHFTFLGYRGYRWESGVPAPTLQAAPGTGLGLLRSDRYMDSPFVLRGQGTVPETPVASLLTITKADSRSTVHHRGYLDFVGVTMHDDAGEAVEEHQFFGLFSSAAYNVNLSRIPVLRRKVEQVLRASDLTRDSHSGKAMVDILETYPRDELFQASVAELVPVAVAALQLRERHQLRFFVRREANGRYSSCLVYLPRDRYTTQVRERMQVILMQTLGAARIDYTTRVSESALARVHFVVRAPEGEALQDFDEEALEKELTLAARSWTDDITVALGNEFGEERGAELAKRYGSAFPEAYKEDFSPQVAARDLRQLESATEEFLAPALYDFAGAAPGEARFKIFHQRDPLSLSDVLPLLSAMGVEVVDERPYRIDRASGAAWIYDFGLRRSTPFGPGSRERFQEAFQAVWTGRAESDGLSALVLEAGLPWRKVSILRAYASYLGQCGLPFSRDYVELTLTSNPAIAAQLVALFEARFDPDSDGLAPNSTSRAARIGELETSLARALDDVSSLDHDQILRMSLAAISATLRTNYYQLAEDGLPKLHLSLKLAPDRIPDVPRPRPRFEVFVYSVRVEGVHLRFGPVARGGLRWSNRREDFRTEVLGLVKAQMVKNAVIVPVGAKGGFYAKKLPDPAIDSGAWLEEGKACYSMFIRGLLDVTDNRVDGGTVPPDRVVRHDSDDSYLVVAADKGTATFSDLANSIAGEYAFWLGDAFASGGSVGYDHKTMGITARGAWISVQRHFRERGIDCQTEDFTCAGIGDMSGDVFGNGMLLSEHTRLVAAFDHRDIFLDPDPDSALSHAERRRLFALPRSRWTDYDRDLLSEGGGIFSRSLKSIPVSPQVRQRLGLPAQTTRLTPAELMTAILKSPVDLLWNGGIGTYVKSSTESHREAGDKANDSIRVDGADLRCRVVGEGGNLGLTQRGRIEYAMTGGRINTDFIDNSGGVDTSDHEVNIKIPLARAMAAGDTGDAERQRLLASFTDEVAGLVLANNYRQNVALANAAANAPNELHEHESWIRALERRGLLDRAIEFLPGAKELTARRAAGRGLTTPELAVLFAYTKIVLAADLLRGELPADPFLDDVFQSYFPAALDREHHKQVANHPLRREILVAQLVNDVIDFAGITFLHRLGRESGAGVTDLVRAHIICRRVFDITPLMQRIDALDNLVGAEVQSDMRLAVVSLIERACRWVVGNRAAPLDMAATLGELAVVTDVLDAVPEILVGGQQVALMARRDALVLEGVPLGLATEVATMMFAYFVLDAAEIARRKDADPITVARLHVAVADHLGLSRLAERISGLPHDDRWQSVARADLRADLQSLHATLTTRVLVATDDSSDPADRILRWESSNTTLVDRTRTALEDVLSSGQSDLARLLVGLRVIRGLVDGPPQR